MCKSSTFKPPLHLFLTCVIIQQTATARFIITAEQPHHPETRSHVSLSGNVLIGTLLIDAEAFFLENICKQIFWGSADQRLRMPA